MLFLPIFILSLAFTSEEDRSIETYCFPSETARIRVEKKLNSILVPSDKLESENKCITVHMRPHRRELIHNYTFGLDSDMRVTFSSEEVKRDPCTLKVEKVREIKKNKMNVELSAFPNVTQGQQVESSKDVMQIQTLNKFSFVVSHDAIEGDCRFINKDLYEITITARRDPMPIVPPNLPTGTIVNIQTPPPDQKTLNVSTSLQLTRGSRIEIGSIVRDLRKKERDLSIKPEAQIENSTGTEEEIVFLSFQ